MPFCIPSLADPSAGVNCFNMVLTLVFRVIMRLLSFFFKCRHPLCPSFACLPRQPRRSIPKNKQKYIAPSVAKLRRSKQFKRFRRLKYPRSYRSKGSSPGKKCLQSFGPQPFGIDFQRVQPNGFKPTTKLQFPEHAGMPRLAQFCSEMFRILTDESPITSIGIF